MLVHVESNQTDEENHMAKTKTCDCCLMPRTDLKEKAWGDRDMLLCATCAKAGRAKVMARVVARAAEVERAKDAAAAVGDREAVRAIDEAAREPKAEAPAKPKRRAKEPKAPRVTVGGTIRELHAAGKSNADIWAAIQPQFGLSADKKWYVSWYLWQARKKAEAGA
jgi:hypothetical protein